MHPAGLQASSPSLRHVSAGHSNDAEEATDTSRSARASRRDVAGQPEPPDALDSSVGAAGTLPIPCVELEGVLPATLKRHSSSRRARAYGTFLYKLVPGVSCLRLPSLARRQGRPRKRGRTRRTKVNVPVPITARIDQQQELSPRRSHGALRPRCSGGVS